MERDNIAAGFFEMDRQLSRLALTCLLLIWLPAQSQIVGEETFADSFEDRGLPPDPALVATPVDDGLPYDLGDNTEFLYTGPNPIQKGVAPGVIEKRRAAVLRGRLLNGGGGAASGIRVSILDHPELGETLTRPDGAFDLAVNGGGPLVLVFEKDGWLTMQRQVDVPWQDFVTLPDAVLVPVNGKVDEVALGPGMPMQMARGSLVTDEAGTRQGAVVFPAGVSAEMVMDQGNTQALNALDLRITEYTVGPMGPMAMPAGLPPASAYTYAVELSVDQAMAAGADEVRFDRPVPYYVDNFLGLPVGSAIPYGYYDRKAGQWVAEPDGVVMKVLEILPSGAVVDTDGDDLVDDPAVLDELGIGAEELEALADLYAAGDTLWRVQLTHFSPHDFNLPPGPVAPENAITPPAPNRDNGGGERKNKEVTLHSDDPCEQAGSVVECQNRVLGESLPITGSPFSLNFRSDRTAGFRLGRSTEILLAGPSVPDSLKRIELEIKIAGRSFSRTYPPDPDQTDTFEWDGLDAYGREVLGSARATFKISYVYDLQYCAAPRAAAGTGSGAGPPGFGRLCQDGNLITPPAPREGSFDREYTEVLRGASQNFASLGEWGLSVHHGYDPTARVLYLGDGRQVTAPARVDGVIDTFAGGGDSADDGIPADQAKLDGLRDIAIGADGSVYFAERDTHRVRRIDPSGQVTTVAGQLNNRGTSGDGGPAVLAQLSRPTNLAIGPDGSLYISGSSPSLIRRVTPDGIITTVAGGGAINDFNAFNGALATDITTNFGVRAAADGNLYSGSMPLQIGTDGRVSLLPARFGGGPFVGADSAPWFSVIEFLTINGQPTHCLQKITGASANDHYCFTNSGDDGFRITAMTFQQDGSAITLHSDHCLRRFPPLENAGEFLFTRVETLAPSIAFYPSFSDVTVNYYLVDRALEEILVGLDSDAPSGCLATSGNSNAAAEDGGPSVNGTLGGNSRTPLIAPDGSILISDAGFDGDIPRRIRRIRPPLPGFSAEDVLIAEEEAGLLHRFDRRGRHLDTRRSLTGAVLFTFEYDPSGRLTAVVDAFDNRTLIERDADGLPLAVVAPFGQRTALTIGPDGFLTAAANPAGETFTFVYQDARLVEIRDPLNNLTTYTYTAMGALETVTADDGHEITLSTVDLPRGRRSSTTSALGLVRSYAVEKSAGGATTFTNISVAGAETVRVMGQDNTGVTTYPNGMVSVSALLPDPRFGIGTPGGEVLTVETPGGRSLTVTSQRTVTLSDPTDPLSVQTHTQTRQVGSRTTTSVFDAATRTITNTSPSGRQSSVVIDDLGQTVSAVPGPGVAPISLQYNAFGQLARREQNAEGIDYAYDSLGRLASKRNDLGQELRFTYDGADRLKTTTTPGGRVYAFDYDARGELVAVTMPSGSVHTLASTLFSAPAGYEAPGAPPLTQDYDADRRRTGLTLPDGRAQTFAFDPQGRSSIIAYPEAQVGLTYLGNTEQFHRLTRSPVPAGTAHVIEYGYDGDLVTSVTVGADSLAYRYDPDLRLAGVQLNSEPEWTYQHDDDDLVTGYGPFSITRTGPVGRPGTLSDGALEIGYAFDDRGRLTGRTYRVNGTEVYALDLSFEAATERLARRTETFAAGASISDYTYTPDGELATVTIDGVETHRYSYDVNGNRTAVNAEMATFDSQDRMLTRGGVTYTFDVNGMLVSRNGDTLEYSARGELISLTLAGGPTITYGYDALARMISRTDSAGTATFIYGDPGSAFQILASRAADGTLTRYFYDESGILVALDRNGTKFYVAADQVGSPRLVIDAAGVVVKRLDYDPFGAIISDSNPSFDLIFGFAGGLHDPATGLVRFGLRDYDPAAGRWTARDPLLFDAGQPNLYAYANSNPISLRDPSGLLCVGFEAYQGYGAGLKLCLKDGKWSVCAETGLAVGGGFGLDLTGAAASRADADYVSASAGISCGPVGFGGNLKIDDCGNFKACVTASGKFLGLGASSAKCKNFLTGQATSGSGISKSLADVEISDGSAAASQDTQDGKIKCKGSAGIKGGVCIGSNTF